MLLSFKVRVFLYVFLRSYNGNCRENECLLKSTEWVKKEAPVDTGAVYQN